MCVYIYIFSVVREREDASEQVAGDSVVLKVEGGGSKEEVVEGGRWGGGGRGAGGEKITYLTLFQTNSSR